MSLKDPMSSSPDQNLQYVCFQEWIQLQEQALSELTPYRLDHLTPLVQRKIQNVENYVNKRAKLPREDVSAAYYAPTWCTALESSHLWIAGCRPFVFIRLVYTLCGFEIDSRLTEFMRGERNDDLGASSPPRNSRRLIPYIQAETIREENELLSKVASLQEDLADDPLALIVREASRIDESAGEAITRLMNKRGMLSVLEEADQLSLSTLKELINVLTPQQAVDFLASAKKLHLCMNAWGQKSDQ